MTPLQVTRIAGFGKKPPQSFSQSPVIFGTGAGCNVRFDAAWDKGVAAHHVRLDWNNNYWSLTDAGSQSGTWIDGRKLAQAYPVTGPVEIELGKGGPRCRVEPLGAPAGQPAAAPTYANAPAQPQAPVYPQPKQSSSGVPVPVLAALGVVVFLLVAGAAWYFLNYQKEHAPLDMASSAKAATLPPGVDEHPVNPPSPTAAPNPPPVPVPAPQPAPGPEPAPSNQPVPPPSPDHPFVLIEPADPQPTEAAGSHKLGLTALTPDEQRWVHNHFHAAAGVRLNAVGLARMKAGSNSTYSVDTPPAAFGDEVVDRTNSGSTYAAEGPNVDDVTPTKLPVAVDNSTKPTFPGVGNQEFLNSCTCYSSVYYAASNNIAVARGLSAPVPLSPIFTYNFINGGENIGSTLPYVYLLLQTHGAPPLSMLPYPSEAGQNPAPVQAYRPWPTDPAIWREALKYRIGKTGTFEDLDTPAGLQRLKAYLANGYLANYSSIIADEDGEVMHHGWTGNYSLAKSNPSLSDEGNAVAGQPVLCCVGEGTGGHAMTIVGYNDDVWVDFNNDGIVQPEEKGALKIVNSWGKDHFLRKQDGGFAWISYDALKDHSQFSWIEQKDRIPALDNKEAFYMLPDKHPDSPFLAQFTLSNAHRDEIAVRLGLSDSHSKSPSVTWDPAMLAPPQLDADTRVTSHVANGGPHAFDGGNREVSGTFAFPLDNLTSEFHVASEDIDKDGYAIYRFYLMVSDLRAGSPTTVTDFEITDPDGKPLAGGPLKGTSVDNDTISMGVDVPVKVR